VHGVDSVLEAVGALGAENIGLTDWEIIEANWSRAEAVRRESDLLESLTLGR